MIDVREYQDSDGRSPFAQWFTGLNAQAAAKVTIAITRIGQGHTSNVKGVGGGTKKRQKGDIEAALDHWQDYKRRK